jgi:hypothetical protein
LLRKDVKYQWKDEQELGFTLFKERLMNVPILKSPSFNKEFIIRTDISYDGVWGETNKEHSVNYTK